MIDFTNLYKNYNSTSHWYKADTNAATLIALVIFLDKERDNNSLKAPKIPGASIDSRPGLEIQKFDNVGKFKTVGGVKLVFCTEHC